MEGDEYSEEAVGEEGFRAPGEEEEGEDEEDEVDEVVEGGTDMMTVTEVN